MSWPGLTSSVIVGAGKESKAAKMGPMSESVYLDYQTELEIVRKKNSHSGSRRPKIDPPDRGWTGAKTPGRKYGGRVQDKIIGRSKPTRSKIIVRAGAGAGVGRGRSGSSKGRGGSARGRGRR